jgi:ElaB/YqjD/DUF883 family membrane-anchored ribosome-binding protein
MSSIVEILNNHINSRFSYNKESYINESITGKLLGGLGAAGAGAYAYHKLVNGVDDGGDHEGGGHEGGGHEGGGHEGGIFKNFINDVKYNLSSNPATKAEAAAELAHSGQEKAQHAANMLQHASEKLNTVLPQAHTVPQPQTPTATQPQSQPTAPQASANQDENHAASAIKNVGLATSQFVQQNPLAAGAIGASGAIGAGIMAKRAMQNNRQ